MPYELAVLDFDGVILNSEPYHFNVRELLIDKYCAGVQYDTIDCVGKSVTEFYSEMLRRSGEKNEDGTLAALLSELHFSMVFDSIRNHSIRENPGVSDFINALKQAGLKTAVASSSSIAYVGRCLSYLGLGETFDWVCCGENVKRAKPYPDIYEFVLSLASCAPKSAFAVEDSRSGAKAASDAGIVCYGYSQKGREEMVPGTTATVGSFAELLNILELGNVEVKYGKGQ